MKRITICLLTIYAAVQVCSAGNARLPQTAAAPSSVFGASLGDLVWLDRNGDGKQDAGENGFAGIVVILLDANGVQVSETVTDSNGKYLFSDMDAGTSGKEYEVMFKLPDNFRFSRHTGSISDLQNSDADEISGRTGLITVLPGQVNDAVDAGLVIPVLGTLPLHTLDLSVELKGSTVKLKWLAENEMNTERFVIQLSTDGINFSNIGVASINGVQNIPTYYNYTTDVSTLAGNAILYFRIRAEDNVYRTAYSNIIAVRMDAITGIRVWPNPFINNLQISYTGTVNAELDLLLTDNSGKRAWQGSLDITHGMNQLSLQGLSGLPSGLYFLRITDHTSGKIFTQRLVK